MPRDKTLRDEMSRVEMTVAAPRLVRFLRVSVRMAVFGLLVLTVRSRIGLAAGGVREVVIVNETFDGPVGEIESRTAAFARQVEVRTGWKQGSLSAKFFSDYKSGADYIEKRHPEFALVSPYAFARLSAEQKDKVEVLAQAVAAEDLQNGGKTRVRLIARKSAPVDVNVRGTPGLRLALPKDGDIQWVNVLMDGTVHPLTHFRIVTVANTAEAVESVATGAADVTFVDESYRRTIERRFSEISGDLKVAYNAPDLPPVALVALKRFVRADDQKKLQAAVRSICINEGMAVCTGLGVVGLVPGPHPLHPHLAYKYRFYTQ